MGHTGAIIDLGGHLGEDRCDARPGLFRATGHHRGAIARAILTARHTHAHVEQAVLGHLLGTTFGVLKPFVATVDDQISRLKVFHKLGDRQIHRLTRLDQHDHLARRLQGGHKLAQVMETGQRQIALLFGPGHRGIDPSGASVPD